jgi:hypothetical protein
MDDNISVGMEVGWMENAGEVFAQIWSIIYRQGVESALGGHQLPTFNLLIIAFVYFYLHRTRCSVIMNGASYELRVLRESCLVCK